MSSEPAGLSVDALSHRYGDREALRGVSFDVRAGAIFALLGPNGGGKTTLFRLVSTVLPAPTGSVRIFGRDVADEPDVVRRMLGVVFQTPALDPRLTVTENLRCHAHLYGLRGRSLATPLADTLELVGLADRAADIVQTLSGGLQRRVELAKALLPDPKLLVLDEPSTGLDPGVRREIWDHLERMRRDRGTTIVLTTHLMDEAARADDVGVLHEGQLVARGAPHDLIGAVGGDVIHITSPHMETLARDIRQRFGDQVDVLDGHLRIERPRGHEFITELVEAFPGAIDAVTFGKPTLEDVFLHHTGRRFDG